MLLKYCPQCAAIAGSLLGNGNLKCDKCGYFGKFREGAMDEINAYKRSLKFGKPAFVQDENSTVMRHDAPITNLIEEEQGERPHANVKPGTLRDLKEKLRSMKGKKFGDIEFL